MRSSWNVFKETRDRTSFQGRYIMRHPYSGKMDCPEAAQYMRSVRDRREKEAQTVARLSGWPIEEVREKMGPPPFEDASSGEKGTEPWWKRIWKSDKP